MCSRLCYFATYSVCICKACGGVNHGSGTTVQSYLEYDRREAIGSTTNISERIVSKQSIVFYNSPTFQPRQIHYLGLPKPISLPIETEDLPMDILKDAGIYAVSFICPPIGTAIGLYKTTKFVYTLYKDIRDNDEEKLISDVSRNLATGFVEQIGLSSFAQLVPPIIQTQQNTCTVESELSNEIFSLGSKSLLVSSSVNLTDFAVKTTLTYNQDN